MQPLQLHLREELQRVARCNTLPPWKDQPLAQRFSECFVLQGEVRAPPPHPNPNQPPEARLRPHPP